MDLNKLLFPNNIINVKKVKHCKEEGQSRIELSIYCHSLKEYLDQHKTLILRQK